MNYKNKLKIMMVAIGALYGCQGFASAGKAGKIVATQAARMAFQVGKSSINLSPNVIQAAKQSQSRLYSQHTPKIAASALMKQQVAEGKQGADSLTIAKWLAVGGLAVAADIAHDEMNTIDFEDIDKEKIPNLKERADYLYYITENYFDFEEKFDSELIAHKICNNFSYGKIWALFYELSDMSGKSKITELDIINRLEDLQGNEVDKVYLARRTDFEKMKTAHHEAGHAVIYALYMYEKQLIISATITSRKTALGGVESCYLHWNNFMHGL